MLFTNDNIDIGHCFIVSVKFGGVNFERECTNTASFCCQSIGFSISYLRLTPRLKSKWLELILALNHFSKQSAATFNLQLNILEIGIFFFFS